MTAPTRLRPPRRRFLLKARFQGRLATYPILLAAATLTAAYSLALLARTAAAAAAAAGSLSFWWVFAEELGEDPGLVVQTLEGILASLAPALALCLLTVFPAVSAARFAVTVVSSHRVAGVLFRLEGIAAGLERRRLIGRMHLRAGDQAKPVVAELNTWVALQRRNLEELRVRGAAFETVLSRCGALAACGAGVEVDRALADLGGLGDGFCTEVRRRP